MRRNELRVNRRRFEARIEGEGATEAVGEEDDDAEEPSTAEPPPIVPAQRARDLAVGDTCELLTGFELAGRTGVCGKPRSAGRYTVAVDDRTVSVAFWQVHGGEGGADHKLLGLDPRDVMPSKGVAIDAAYRAAARDAAYASRLVRGAAAVDEESIRGADAASLSTFGLPRRWRLEAHIPRTQAHAITFLMTTAR